GSAAQVGLKRLGAIAHRVEDLIGSIRDGELEPSPQVIDLCLESTDVLKKTLQKQWADEAEMRTGVDSLLAQIAEFAPIESEESEQAAPAQLTENAEAAATPAARTNNAEKTQQAAAIAKSVRISLQRLDRMMNTVGELVINRTRMVGRVTELERLVETLSFSKERLQGKVAEFQEKYEYNKLNTSSFVAPQATT